MQCSSVRPNVYREHPELFSWHMFVLNEHEYQRLRVWNTNQVYRQCGYNFSDLVYQILPETMKTVFVPDITREKAQYPQKLFCSQAVVLALREACNGMHTSPHMESFTKAMNSRIITPTELAYRTTTYMGLDISNEPVPLTEVEANLVVQKNLLLHMEV